MASFSGYGQICPLAKAAEALCERWTLLILRELAFGSHRFGEVQRGVPMISPGMLSQRLRQLEEAGIVVRRSASGSSRSAPGNVTYELTTSGQEVAQIMREMSAWGKRWAVAELRPDDMEPSYMMWLAHRTIRTAPLGTARVVINYEFHDAPAGRRRWWLVVEDGNVDLCFKHPGFAIDLTVSTRLRPMAELLLGRLSPDQAVRSRAVRLEGSRLLARRFAAWYPRSYEYEGEPARQAAAMLKDAASTSRPPSRRRDSQPS
jgi:DNA-binding HxlR family transcriptional regulator